MIKFKTENGSVDIEMHGPAIVLLADTIDALTSIYRGFPESLKEGFRKEVQKATAEDGACWMTEEQRRERVRAMLQELLEKMMKEAGSGESRP